MRVSIGISKHKALDCLIKEIKILSECDHRNIAKILEASLNGVLVKEYAKPTVNDKEVSNSGVLEEMEGTSFQKIRRKSNICYYVMRLAEHGELYKFIEHTDRFSERFARTLYT